MKKQDRTLSRAMKRHVSIVVPCFNGLRFTRRCIDSLLRYTSYPFELVVIDNGSHDGTKDFFRDLSKTVAGRSSSLVGCTFIDNSNNRGVAAAVNQGIRKTRSAFVCYLNSDIIVTAGWLERLVFHASADKKIGVVGCCTNLADENCSAQPDMREIQRIAAAMALSRDRAYSPAAFVHGFCMLIKREVIDTVGLFDERFYPCAFEDLDYCLRTLKSGYKLITALDVFLYHFSGRSKHSRCFDAAHGGFKATDKKMHQVFIDKWGEDGVVFLRNLPRRLKLSEHAAVKIH